MKKTKLLMPLMGLTVLGAVAPVMTITSCNKGAAVVMDYAVAGNLYDETKLLVTNRLGKESIGSNETAINNLRFVCHLPQPLTKGHKILMEMERQGYDDTYPIDEQTPFIVNTVQKTAVVNTANTTWFVIDLGNYGSPVIINDKKIQALTQAEAEQNFTFNVKFTETDSNNNTITTQTVAFTLVACPIKHDIPHILPKQSSGITGSAKAGETTVKFTGLNFNKDSSMPSFTPKFANDTYIWMDENDSGNNREISIYALADTEIEKDPDNYNLTFYGYSNKEFEDTEIEVNFDEWYNININIICTEDEGQEDHYVLPSWQCTATIKHTYGEAWNVNVTK